MHGNVLQRVFRVGIFNKEENLVILCVLNLANLRKIWEYENIHTCKSMEVFLEKSYLAKITI